MVINTQGCPGSGKRLFDHRCPICGRHFRVADRLRYRPTVTPAHPAKLVADPGPAETQEASPSPEAAQQ